MSLSPEDVAVAYRDRPLELVQFLVDRIGELESKVAGLESHRDAAASCVHWTKAEAESLKARLAELDARTLGLVK